MLFVAIVLLSASWILPIEQASDAQPTQTTAAIAGLPKVAPAAKKSGASTDAKAELPPLQIRARELLSQAEIQVNGLDPAMRAYDLWQLSRGYQQFDQLRARKLLDDALTATFAIQDDADTRQNLQTSIAPALAQVAPDRLEELLPQLEKRTRSAVMRKLLQRHIEKKEFDRALDLVLRASRDADFPYRSAAELMRALPSDRGADRQQIFSAALLSYRNHHETTVMSGGDFDFDSLIVNFWRQMPEALVSEAIDEWLKHADPENASDLLKKTTISLSGPQGAVAFSVYEYRLFQVMPILNIIDPERAKTLLDQHAVVRAQIERFPGGPAEAVTLSSSANSNPSAMPIASTGVGDGSYDQSGRSAEWAWMSRIVDEANAHPNDALANVSTFRDPHIRASALIAIAQTTYKKDPTTAKLALERLLDMTEQAPGWMQPQSFREAAETYLKMNEKASAEQVLDRGDSAAAKLYSKDSDNDDPNKALKAFWPSTQAWQQLIRLAVKITPDLAVEIVNNIPDYAIKVTERIALANAWLDVRPGRMVIVEKHNNDSNVSTVDVD